MTADLLSRIAEFITLAEAIATNKPGTLLDSGYLRTFAEMALPLLRECQQQLKETPVDLKERIARFRERRLHRAHSPEAFNDNDALPLLDECERRIADLEQQNVFEAQWADKLKEFGTIDRLIGAYSQSKMEARAAKARIEELETKLNELR